MLEVHATIDGFSRIDFDRKKIRKVLRKEGGEVRKIARKLIGRRVVSRPGEYAGRDTGRMIRSIKAVVSKPGFLVRIAPSKTAEMKDFYPAFLNYGSATNNLAPRRNFMIDALDARREIARGAILGALQDSIIPRK